jgi:riboflavin synthase
MFTGLIEEIGKIGSLKPIPGGKRLEILCNDILQDIKVNDSVAVNGVCLTATSVHNTGFWVDAVGETLAKSTLKNMVT